jgi:SnoaL-like polyketide cyclase
MSATDLRQLLDATVDAFNSGDLDSYGAFPDASVTVHDTIAEGDKIVLRDSLYGTHRGEFRASPPPDAASTSPSSRSSASATGVSWSAGRSPT